MCAIITCRKGEHRERNSGDRRKVFPRLLEAFDYSASWLVVTAASLAVTGDGILGNTGSKRTGRTNAPCMVNISCRGAFFIKTAFWLLWLDFFYHELSAYLVLVQIRNTLREKRMCTERISNYSSSTDAIRTLFPSSPPDYDTRVQHLGISTPTRHTANQHEKPVS